MSAIGEVAGERRGLGTKAHNAIEEGDDEFTRYRKLMMTGYKHRPNRCATSARWPSAGKWRSALTDGVLQSRQPAQELLLILSCQDKFSTHSTASCGVSARTILAALQRSKPS